jgi:ABC-type glycerol-3-phosphate transport system substrate-binding protein
MRCLILVILLLTFCTACNKAPDDVIETLPSSKQTDLVAVTLAVEELDLSRYRPLIALFEQEHPHIRVHLVSVTEITDHEVEDQVRAMASSFDIFPYSFSRQGSTQYLLDLSPFLDLDSRFDRDDFLSGLLPAAQEPLWAVPTGAAYQVTFFDKSAFDAAGFTYPLLDWTTDDFLAAALVLTTRENNHVTRWGYVPGQMRYPPLLATLLTGPLQTSDGLRLTDPDVVAALQWLGDLFTVHQVSPWLDDYRPPGRRTGAGQPALSLINSSQAAMWHTTQLLYNENDTNIGVTAVPRGPFGFAAEPIVSGFAVSRGTRTPEAAWQLLHFLSRQPPHEMGAFPVSPVPARRSVAEATKYWEHLPARLAAVLRYTAENNSAPRISYQVANLLLEALASHIDDNMDVAAALSQRIAAGVAPPELAETEAIVVQESEIKATNDATQFTFMTYPYLFEQHRLLANQFQSEFRGLAVRLERSSPGGISRLNQLAAADCFVAIPGALDEELRAATLPLNPLLEIDGSLHLDDFFPLLRDSVLDSGELSGLPAWIRVDHIHYNRQLFDAAGVPEPTLDWTLADFLEIAQQLTTGHGESKQFGYAEHFIYLFPRGRTAFGVQLVDYSTEPPQFDYQAAAEMVAWYVDLVQLYEVQPPLTGNSTVDFALFQMLLSGGQVAMWPSLQTGAVVAMQNTPLNYEIGSAPVPLGLSGSRGDISSQIHAYYILDHSPNRQACWQWIKFLSNHPQAVPTGTNAGYPAQIKVAESKEYIDQVGADFAAVAHAFVTFNHTVLFPPAPLWMSPGFDWLREVYQQATNNQVDVATALAAAGEKFSLYRECVFLAGAVDDYAKWRLCAIQLDPSLADYYR